MNQKRIDELADALRAQGLTWNQTNFAISLIRNELELDRGRLAQDERSALAEYESRAKPRLAAIDRLAAKLDFSTTSWRLTPEGERYQRLMEEQGRDELAMGL